MVHLNVQHAPPQANVSNDPCKHAFVLMGRETLFAVHMTQYHCDKHRYQVVLRISLPDKARDEYLWLRAEHPEATFIFCSGEQKDEKFSIPQLGAVHVDRDRKPGEPDRMHGNIFFGFRPPVTDPPPPHWFPWNLDDTIPMIANVSVTVERIILYRPFSVQDVAPGKATYLIFGMGNEACMTNIQTGRLLTGPEDLPLYGLDIDHIMTLDAAPDWLDKDMLEAGTVVTVPAFDRYDAEGHLILHEAPPFGNHSDFFCLYRGLQPPRKLTAGVTYFWGSMVCNSEELVPVTPGMSQIITDMPRRYWR